jgi:hypothetical protein
VLYAVAAAVIGGTSLFGGRGKMLGAVLGGLVVGVSYNWLFLLASGQPLRTCGPLRSWSLRWPLMPWPAGEARPHPAEFAVSLADLCPGRYLAASW